MEDQKTVTNEQQTAQVINHLRELANNVAFSRASFFQQLMDPRRSINDECGYPETESLTKELFKTFYEREAVATRVVEVLPQETWQIQPEVYETEEPDQTTAFEESWDSLGSQLRETGWYRSEEGSSVWEYLLRADVLSGIGSYGLLLLGVDDKKELIEPLDLNQHQGRKLLFLRAFDESLISIDSYEHDKANPRFGQPNIYNVSFNNPNITMGQGVELSTEKVHWTRVIHLADNLGSSEIFGVSRIRPVYNRIYDLRKLYSGSAEMYWKGAFPGLSIETHPQLGGDVPALQDATMKDAMRTQIEQYYNGLQRTLNLMGMTAKSLAPQVVDPTKQIEVQIQAICIRLGIPKRIFEGSERGELSSSQDQRSWHARLKARQDNYVTPRIIVPFIDRLIQIGVLPEPKEYFVKWTDLDTLTEQEQAEVAVKKTEAMAKYVGGNVEAILTPLDFYARILAMDDKEAEAVIESVMEAEPLIIVEEDEEFETKEAEVPAKTDASKEK